MRVRLFVFVTIVQSILFLTHWFLYATWKNFWGMPDPPGISKLQVTLALLSVSFVAASLLAFRSFHLLVRLFYTIAAVWLGILSFCFLAACSCWIVYALLRLAGLPWDRRVLAAVLFSLAILASLYGLVNASQIGIKRVTIQLSNLPEPWRGRVAALVSDLHLGHVRNYRFVLRVVTMLNRLRPHAVFIAGDLFDGTPADLDRLTKPWEALPVPLGTYFVTGNHEEFSDPTKYLDALRRSGVRVLDNEKLILDGLQIVGVNHADLTEPQHFRSILREAALDRDRASILLTHASARMSIAEEEGISLQVCGHTHGGQFFPFTWVASRIYGKYSYGLRRRGTLLTYTSSGAGTWGPPLRVGTRPEIVLIQFE